jgi:hypothetical protein
MGDNPGVTIRNVQPDIWDQETLTSLSGGTSPSMFMADVVAHFDNSGTKSAMRRGLMADVTEQIEKHDVASRLADFAVPIWAEWEIEGRFYAAPHSYSCGNGVHYRKDLIAELGLEEPQVGWTWGDVRELANSLTDDNRHGIALQGWVLQHFLSADGFVMLSQLPAPDASWNWRWDYTSMADAWIPLIEQVRGMIFEDGSVLSDISFVDDDVRSAFIQGRAAMHNSTSIFYTATPDEDLAHVRLEEELGKPLHEIVGWVPQPQGMNGRTGSTQGEIFLLGFSPDLNADEIDAALSLHLYMLGPGHVHGKTAVYDRTSDPRHVYDWGEMTPILKGVADELPSSAEEAWGEEFMNRVYEAQQVPLVPSESVYFPVEESTGPASTAYDDMMSRWFYESGDLDLRADLQRLEDTVNTQAEGFTSSIPEDVFIESAQAYYAAHAEYWQENAPEFYENVYRDWHERFVRPVIGD